MIYLYRVGKCKTVSFINSEDKVMTEAGADPNSRPETRSGSTCRRTPQVILIVGNVHDLLSAMQPFEL